MLNSSKKIKYALHELAQLLEISIQQGWLKELAKRLNVSEPSIYACVKNDKISKPVWKKIDKLNIPREQWYIEPEPYPEGKEDIGIPKQDDGRNPFSNPSYAVPPDHLEGHRATGIMMAVRPQLAPLVSKLESALNQEEEIKGIIQAIDRGDGDTLRAVVEVLNSGESGTIIALKMNVMEFRQKIKEREELRDMKATLGHMKKRQGDLEILLDKEKKEPPGLCEPTDLAENN